MPSPSFCSADSCARVQSPFPRQDRGADRVRRDGRRGAPYAASLQHVPGTQRKHGARTLMSTALSSRWTEGIASASWRFHLPHRDPHDQHQNSRTITCSETYARHFSHNLQGRALLLVHCLQTGSYPGSTAGSVLVSRPVFTNFRFGSRIVSESRVRQRAQP